MEADVPRHAYGLTSFIIAFLTLCPARLLPKACGLAESTGPGGSNAQTVHQIGYFGQDVNVGLISADNIRTSHEAFYDKDSNGTPTGQTHAFNYDFTGGGIQTSNHDTAVAGIVASRAGISHPNDIGVAPGVDIHSARVVDDNDTIKSEYLLNALDELITVQDCRVIVTGIALPSNPNGESFWSLLYDYYAYKYDTVFANAAGNNGSKIAVFGDAYNGITTGGLILNDPNNEYIYREVGDISGSGPTSDGRRKPDVAGPSEKQTVPQAGSDTAWTTLAANLGQTSYSTPHVAGTAALLLSLADDTVEVNDSQNEVIRAVIVNSAFPNIDDKNGAWTNPADSNNTWNSDRGYGRIDALRAYQTLNAGRITRNIPSTQMAGWAFEGIDSNGQPNSVHTYEIYAEKAERLRATLTWDRRVRWYAGNLEGFRANLDLEIQEPNSRVVIFSEENNNLDPNDNLEKCDLLLSKTGEYLIKVVNKSPDESPDYGLAFEILPSIPGDFEPMDYKVDTLDLAKFTNWWLRDDCSGLNDWCEGADLEPADSRVDLADFARFAGHWLENDPAYCQP